MVGTSILSTQQWGCHRLPPHLLQPTLAANMMLDFRPKKRYINLTQRERTIWTVWLMGGSDNLASEIYSLSEVILIRVIMTGISLV